MPAIVNVNAYIQTVLPSLQGWCTPQKASHLAELVLAERPRYALEIGIYAGRSFFAIALAQQAAHANCQTLGIDPWNSGASTQGFEEDAANRDWWRALDHNAIYQQFMRYRSELALERSTLVFTGTSRQAFPAIAFAHPQPFLGLLHIDGNHSAANALADVNEYVPLTLPGASVVLDDTNWETVKPAQARLAELCDTVQVVDQGDKGCYAIYRKR